MYKFGISKYVLSYIELLLRRIPVKSRMDGTPTPLSDALSSWLDMLRKLFQRATVKHAAFSILHQYYARKIHPQISCPGSLAFDSHMTGSNVDVGYGLRNGWIARWTDEWWSDVERRGCQPRLSPKSIWILSILILPLITRVLKECYNCANS